MLFLNYSWFFLLWNVGEQVFEKKTGFLKKKVTETQRWGLVVLGEAQFCHIELAIQNMTGTPYKTYC